MRRRSQGSPSRSAPSGRGGWRARRSQERGAVERPAGAVGEQEAELDAHDRHPDEQAPRVEGARPGALAAPLVSGRKQSVASRATA